MKTETALTWSDLGKLVVDVPTHSGLIARVVDEIILLSRVKQGEKTVQSWNQPVMNRRLRGRRETVSKALGHSRGLITVTKIPGTNDCLKLLEIIVKVTAVH